MPLFIKGVRGRAGGANAEKAEMAEPLRESNLLAPTVTRDPSPVREHSHTQLGLDGNAELWASPLPSQKAPPHSPPVGFPSDS